MATEKEPSAPNEPNRDFLQGFVLIGEAEMD